MNIVPTAGYEAILETETHALLLRLADDVAQEARQNAPVRTGELRASIHVEDDGEAVAVVASAPYAAYVELGTRKMHAEPYLQPALFHERSGS